MIVKDTGTGFDYKAEIKPVSIIDFKTIKKDKSRFKRFDWSKYKSREVYKLTIEGNNKILGLMSIIDHTDIQTNAIEIELLEVSDENIGPKK